VLIIRFQNEFNEETNDLGLENLPDGRYSEIFIQIKGSQSFFINIMLSSLIQKYGSRGLEIPDLLVANYVYLNKMMR